MSSEQDPSADSLALVARLRSRFRGALLGLAVGDALAAAVQFARPGSFAPVRDLLGGGPFDLPRGAWSDDTALTLALARSLLEQGRCDVDDQRERFRRWQRDGEGSATGECLGITGSVARALAAGAPDSTVADGADALARTAPLAMFRFGDEPRLLEDLRSMAGVTSHETTTVEVVENFGLTLGAALAGRHAPLEVHALRRVDQGNEAARVLALATQAVAETTSWKQAVLQVVNQGGDADVVAAVCGQLAGAVYGVEAIPLAWRAALMQREAMEEIADALLAEALIALAEASGEPSS
ncbi:MAG: ADP-ribosylglycohydrolase family protein [Sinobacteraceae bacterium]|nr:ADP-ribosylglycohydrolase family protein [Nevskiaceae bacterium]